MSKINCRKILSFLLSFLILTFNLQFDSSRNPVEAQSSEPSTFGVDENMWMVNGGVFGRDIVVTDDYTYLGGGFNSVAPSTSYTGRGVVLSTDTAQRYISYPKIDGEVFAVASDGNGGWYVGGQFFYVGDYKRVSIAHIKNDGTVDVDWDPNPNLGARVTCITVSGSDIYVGGRFTTIGGQSRNSIAKLNNTTGAADLTWNPNAGHEVYSIAISGSDIYVGGYFTSIGGQPRNRIAKLNNTTGAADLTWNPNSSGWVNTIAISGSDIYVGGYFTSIGGQNRNYIAKLNNTTGAADLTWNPNAGYEVYSIAISGSDIYVGGYFTSIGGQSRNYIAKLNNTTGAADPVWNPNADGGVNNIAISSSDIYIGGTFTSVGGQSQKYVAKLNNTTGEVDINWNPVADSYVNILGVFQDKLFVGGSFGFFGEYFESIRFICRIINETGAVDLTWNPSANGAVYSIAISGADIYVGGSFTSIGGQTRNRIAKLNNTTGATDLTWNPNAGNTVQTIAISGSDIYVGGRFTSIGGQAQNRIAKLNNTTGAADLTWNPNAGGTVQTIVISGSDTYVGGDFTTIGGQSRNRIAKLNNTTGAVDLTWNPNANASVYSIALFGTDSFVGGNFTSIGGQSRSYIAKLDSTGAVVSSWNVPLAVLSSTPVVSSIAVSEDSVYISGSFIGAGGQTRNKVAKLSTDNGEVDSQWDFDAGGGSFAHRILVYGEDVYIVGHFGSIGGVPRAGVARLYSDIQAPAVTVDTLTPDPSTDTTPILTGTASDEIGAISSVEYQIDSTGGSWVPCSVDDGAGDEKSEEFTCTVSSALTDGTHTIYVRATDSNGNTTASGSETADEFIVDLTGPTGTISINSGETITNTDEVTLTLSATDNLTEVKKMMVSNKGDYSGGTWETYNTSKEWRLSMGDGEKRVYVKYRDEVGNISSSYSDSIEMDMGAPTGTLIINEGEEYTSSREVVLHITGEDEVTGVEEMRISEERTMEGVEWEGYETSRGYTLSEGDGYKVIYIQYRDGIGNESEVYGSNITLDRNTEIEVTEIGEEEVEGEITNWETEETTPTFTGEGEVGATITIEIEGIETGTVIVNEDGVWSWTPSIELTRGQEYNVIITSTDLAGNEDIQTFTLGISDEEVIEVNQTTPEAQITTTQLPNTGIMIIVGLMIMGGLLWTGMNFKVIQKLKKAHRR